MNFDRHLRISDFDYHLPSERIAQFPLADRAASRLLHFDADKQSITDAQFHDFPDLIPKESVIVFNETRVVMARLHFFKAGGSRIEIFCLSPLSPLSEVQSAFQLGSGVEWKVLIGNAKKWKTDEVLSLKMEDGNRDIILRAYRCGKEDEAFRVRFEWEPAEMSFAAILEVFGKIPLPPYISREAVGEDQKTYQTVYAKAEGSVAAPTAGLHFTPEILQQLEKEGHHVCKTILHVGAGTFKPVDAECMTDHHMHSEEIVLTRTLIEDLKNHHKRPVTAIGTTTTRTLESVYWYALLLHQDFSSDLNIGQWLPYQNHAVLTREEALEMVLRKMDQLKTNVIKGTTALLIAPPYKFKMLDNLLTNFHQPKSTLLLLVASHIGDAWKEVYSHAMDSGYRFLSYGDACLFSSITE